MSESHLEDRLLKPAEAAAYLGFRESTIRLKSQRGELPKTKLGRSLRFRKSDLDRWINEQSVTTAAKRAG